MVCMSVGSLIFEYSKEPNLLTRATNLGSLLLVNSILAMGLNVFSVLALARIKALSIAVLAIVKDIVLMCSDVLIFGTHITPIQMAGFLVTIVGVRLYASYKVANA